jgi:hypothetical protein
LLILHGVLGSPPVRAATTPGDDLQALDVAAVFTYDFEEDGPGSLTHSYVGPAPFCDAVLGDPWDPTAWPARSASSAQASC